MTCETLKNELVAYRDGELSEREHEQVVAHLRTCSACAQEEKRLARLDQLLASLEPVSLSPGFAATFWQRVEQEQRATKRTGRFAHRWRDWLESWRLVPAMAAVASLLIFLGYVLFGRHVPPPPQLSPAEPLVQQEVARADLPPLVVAQPDLFVLYRMIADLDKFAHFEEIAAVDPAPEEKTELVMPEDLPAPLRENPSFFVHYPMLQKMEELQNFEAVLSLPGEGEKPNRG